MKDPREKLRRVKPTSPWHGKVFYFHKWFFSPWNNGREPFALCECEDGKMTQVRWHEVQFMNEDYEHNRN